VKVGQEFFIFSPLPKKSKKINRGDESGGKEVIRVKVHVIFVSQSPGSSKSFNCLFIGPL
jgi:hypothetical protein